MWFSWSEILISIFLGIDLCRRRPEMSFLVVQQYPVNFRTHFLLAVCLQILLVLISKGCDAVYDIKTCVLIALRNWTLGSEGGKHTFIWSVPFSRPGVFWENSQHTHMIASYSHSQKNKDAMCLSRSPYSVAFKICNFWGEIAAILWLKYPLCSFETPLSICTLPYIYTEVFHTALSRTYLTCCETVSCRKLTKKCSLFFSTTIAQSI